MFLSHLLFGMGHSALEPVGSWVEPGLRVEMETTGKALAV